MFTRRTLKKVLPVLMVAAVLIVLTAATVSAQATATPVPTAVPPVAISIDTDSLFASTNTWITTFLPVFGLTGGIAIALVLLTFVVKKVVQAFKSAGGASG